MRLKKLLFIASILFSAHFQIFAQKIPSGTELSDIVKSQLKKNNYSPLELELVPTGQDNFAYNIELNFDKSRESSEILKRDTLIFCFKQIDFYKHSKVILDLIADIKNIDRDWNVKFLFSPLFKIPLDGETKKEGTSLYAPAIDDLDSCAAVVVTFDSSAKTEIFTGGSNCTSPLWLTRDFTEAFFYSGVNYTYKNILAAIYRLSIIRGRDQMEDFFSSEIPAITINFSDEGEISVLENFARNYKLTGTDQWDMHYICISHGSLFPAFFISEKLILITCMASGIFTILILCVFSFLGSNGEKQKYEFIRSTYLIPITIGLSFLSLYAGQHLVILLSSFIPLNPVMQYGIKLLLSMILISAMLMFQELLKISVTGFVYSYLLSVIAIFNIFLFSSRDLTLFGLFLAEYAICYLSRLTKRPASILAFFVAALIPFLPYVNTIISYGSDSELMSAVLSSPCGNLKLALAVFPFQIMWLRFLIVLNVYAGGKGYSTKRIIFHGFISVLSILVFLLAVILVISRFVYKPQERAVNKYQEEIIDEEHFLLRVSLSKNTFSGMDTNHIKIQSSQPALRYNVTLTSTNDQHPIYDSIYDYTILEDDNKKDYFSFTIPDFPPQKITLDYAASEESQALIQVTALYQTEDPHIFRRERRELKIE